MIFCVLCFYARSDLATGWALGDAFFSLGLFRAKQFARLKGAIHAFHAFQLGEAGDALPASLALALGIHAWVALHCYTVLCCTVLGCTVLCRTVLYCVCYGTCARV